MKTNTDPKSLQPAKRPILISQIDYPASVALNATVGECAAVSHGLHTVLKGEAWCCKCGAR